MLLTAMSLNLPLPFTIMKKILWVLYLILIRVFIYPFIYKKFICANYFWKNISTWYTKYNNWWKKWIFITYGNHIYDYWHFYNWKDFTSINTPFWVIIFDGIILINWNNDMTSIEEYLGDSLKKYANYNVWIISTSKKQRNNESKVTN